MGALVAQRCDQWHFLVALESEIVVALRLTDDLESGVDSAREVGNVAVGT